jgi:hypothetical protein
MESLLVMPRPARRAGRTCTFLSPKGTWNERAGLRRSSVIRTVHVTEGSGAADVVGDPGVSRNLGDGKSAGK